MGCHPSSEQFLMYFPYIPLKEIHAAFSLVIGAGQNNVHRDLLKICGNRLLNFVIRSHGVGYLQPQYSGIQIQLNLCIDFIGIWMYPELVMMSSNAAQTGTLVLQLFGCIKYVEIHTNLWTSFFSFVFRLSFPSKNINISLFLSFPFLNHRCSACCKGLCKVAIGFLEHTSVNGNRSSAGGTLEKQWQFKCCHQTSSAH